MPGPNVKSDPDRAYAGTAYPVQQKSIWDQAHEALDQRFQYVNVGSPEDWQRWQYSEDQAKKEEEWRRQHEEEMARLDLQMYPYRVNDAFKSAFGTDLDTLRMRAKYIQEDEARDARSMQNLKDMGRSALDYGVGLGIHPDFEFLTLAKKAGVLK